MGEVGIPGARCAMTLSLCLVNAVSAQNHAFTEAQMKVGFRMVSRFSVPKGALVTSKNTRFRPLAAGTHQDVMQQI